MPDYFSSPVDNKPPASTLGSYSKALDDQGDDFDYGMKQYRDLLSNYKDTQPLTYNPVGYSESGDVSDSLNTLSNLANNGGYSAADIANIRARGISPIRSIYSSAQQGLDRSKALQGGYSPNFAAVTAKMARDQSNQIAQAVTNVNATLAQNIASNKLAAAPSFASAASSEAGRKLSANEFDTTNQQDTAKTNAGINSSNLSDKLGILGGMTNLYGTTPAAANTFGNQALQAANINSNNAQASNSAVGGVNANLLSRLPNFANSRMG